jgi:hypothetical protein
MVYFACPDTGIPCALNLLLQARKLAPRDSDVAMVYAALLGTRNDVDGAVKQLDKAVRLEPNNAQPYYQKVRRRAPSPPFVPEQKGSIPCTSSDFVHLRRSWRPRRGT